MKSILLTFLLFMKAKFAKEHLNSVTGTAQVHIVTFLIQLMIKKKLPNYYDEFLNDMTSNSVIALLLLSDYLDITPLTQLICLHLAYLMRDMENEQRLKYFHITDPMEMEYVEM